MIILSHRGFWTTADEKNSVEAFDRSVAEGFGTETDVRDLDGDLVVAHDPPTGRPLPWSAVLDRFDGTGLPLAVNVKADGLSAWLGDAFAERSIDWFAFDMSGPETVRFARAGLPFFTRHSDVESEPILYADAAGVWLDDFAGGWIGLDQIRRHVNVGKRVCVVSPELHGRDYRPFWNMLASAPLADGDLMLCTDLPHLAREYFDQ